MFIEAANFLLNYVKSFFNYHYETNNQLPGQPQEQTCSQESLTVAGFKNEKGKFVSRDNLHPAVSPEEHAMDALTKSYRWHANGNITVGNTTLPASPHQLSVLEGNKGRSL